MTDRSGNTDDMRAPGTVRERADELFEGARAIVGDRFAEARFDPDRGLRVTVIDLTRDDRAALDTLAGRLGIKEWVRIERADPAALERWERLRHDLLRLQERPRLLQEYPTPEPGYRRPPVEIHLSADAEAEAADLHRRYGTFVSLHVGALPYPPPRPGVERPALPDSLSGLSTADPDEMEIRLDGPLSIRRGQTARHMLLLTNRTEREITLFTNGQLTASIVDPRTGATVGGFSGAQRMPRVAFTTAPHRTTGIPILVATASFDPALGYLVPAGIWHLIAPMNLGDGRRLLTPALEVTITEDRPIASPPD